MTELIWNNFSRSWSIGTIDQVRAGNFLPGDICTLDPDGNMHLVQRDRQTWTGVIDFSRLVQYGRNSSGVPLYRCDIIYPPQTRPFFVPVKRIPHPQRGLKYVAVDQTGHIVEWIGEVGNVADDIQAMLWAHELVQLWRQSAKIKTSAAQVPPQSQQPPPVRSIITIDPAGCKDIDDGISIQEDGTIGVHIVDMTTWCQRYPHLLQIAQQRLSSIYLPTGNMPMLPQHISEDMATLRHSTCRPVCSIYFHPDAEIDIRWETVHIARNWSYDDPALIDDPTYRAIHVATGGTLDSHQLVEHWMLKVNHHIGTVLPVDSSSVWRNQSTNSVAAIYETVPGYHAGLDRHSYLHFTSPLRRWTDQWNAMQLRQHIETGSTGIIPVPFSIARLNRQTQAIRRVQQAAMLLHMVSLSEGGSMETDFMVKDVESMCVTGVISSGDHVTIYMNEDALERIDIETGRMYRGTDDLGRWMRGESRRIGLTMLRLAVNPFHKVMVSILE